MPRNGQPMSIKERNNVSDRGSGADTIILAHGFGCDQNMWRVLEPAYVKRYRTASLIT